MLNVEIFSPKGELFSGQCHMAVVPTTAGEIGFLKNHEAVIAKISQGQIKIFDKDENNVSHKFDSVSGVVEIHDGARLLILLDS